MKKRLLSFFCIILIMFSFAGAEKPAPAKAFTAHEAKSLIDGILLFELELNSVTIGETGSDSSDVSRDSEETGSVENDSGQDKGKTGSGSSDSGQKSTELSDELLQKYIDTVLAQGAGKTSEWYAFSLSRYKSGLKFGSYTDSLSSYVNSKTIRNAVERQRDSLILLSCGKKGSSFIKQTANDSIGEQGIMSLVFGLHLLNNGVESEKYTALQLIDKLCEMALDDGGFSVIGTNGDPDVTAMVLQALAPAYKQTASLKADSGLDEASLKTLSLLKETVENALSFLSTKQLSTGGYKSMGNENSESSAQVLTALTALGKDPEKDAKFIKNGNTVLDALASYKLPSGGFSHLSGGAENETATTQALYSLISYYRYKNGKSSLYEISVIDYKKLFAASPETESSETGGNEEGNTGSGSTENGNTENGSAGTGSAESGNTETGGTEANDAETGNTESESAGADDALTGNAETGSTESGGNENGNNENGSAGTGGNEGGNTGSGSTETGSTGTGNTESESAGADDELAVDAENGSAETGNTESESTGSDDALTVDAETGSPETENTENGSSEIVSSEPDGQSANTESPDIKDGSGTVPLYKIIGSCIVAVAALVVCILLFIKKKRGCKNYLPVLAVGAAVLAVLWLTDISSAESYYSESKINCENAVGTVTISVSCDTIKDKADSDYIPKDGVILSKTAVDIEDGDTVYDVLSRVTAAKKIQMESEASVAHGSYYISGINYLYEFDFGDLSGWVYLVNGEMADVGCGEYKLKDGDDILWAYTVDLGQDVSGKTFQ